MESVSSINVRELQSTPHVVLHLLHACDRPDVDFDQLDELIRKDPALVAKVMRESITDSSSIAGSTSSLLLILPMVTVIGWLFIGSGV